LSSVAAGRGTIASRWFCRPPTGSVWARACWWPGSTCFAGPCPGQGGRCQDERQCCAAS